jgi:hypothetical protein
MAKCKMNANLIQKKNVNVQETSQLVFIVGDSFNETVFMMRIRFYERLVVFDIDVLRMCVYRTGV